MTKIGLLIAVLGCALGCRSPRVILHSIQQTNPCCTAASGICETVSVDTVGEAISIEEYVQLGLSRNPRVQEAQHKIDAIRHRIPQVLALPDPMLNSTTYLAPVETAAGRQAFALGVSQKITNAERRGTQAAIICDEAAAAKADLMSVRLEVAEQVRIACYQLLFVRKSIEITREDVDSLDQISQMIERQYQVQKSVTQQDVLNAQVEQSKLENQLTELQQKEKSYQARLARLLHIDPKSQLTILDQLQTTNSELDLDLLISQAVQTRPDLQAQLAIIKRDKKKVRLAHLANKPDFTVGMNWIATSANGISPVANGDDALLLGIGFNLPVYKNRIRAGICEAQANRRASESKFASLQDVVAERIFDLVARIESTNQTLTLVQEDIIPKSQRTLDLSIDEYSTGKADYVQLIENWRNVLRYRIAEANLQSQYCQLLASLARSIGKLTPIHAQPAVTQATFLDVNGMVRAVHCHFDQPDACAQYC